MPVEILTREDLSEALIGLEKKLINSIKLLLENKTADDWIDGHEAMRLLTCKNSKLSQIISSGYIKKRGQGKGSRYSRKSIISYLDSIGR